eukprot:989574-Karenia_brevis.AAC.1
MGNTTVGLGVHMIENDWDILRDHEYTRPDGTVGKVVYDDKISLEGNDADYRIRDPTWADNNTKKT